MNEDNDTIIYCNRCGAEMKSSSRYCMKCGNLNYDHEANKDLRYIQPKEEQTYQVGSGKMINTSLENGKQNLNIAQNTGNDKSCFFVNFIVYLLVICVSFYFSVNGEYSLNSVMNSSFPLILVAISFIFLYFYAIQLVYVKSDKKWWYAFIPIYNLMVLSDIAFHNMFLGLLFIVPGVGFIFYFILFYQLGKKFSYNGLLTALFSFVMIFFIGFGVHSYEGKIFVNYNEKNSLEKKYRYKKVFLVTSLLFMIIGICMFVFADFEHFQSRVAFFGKGYYIYTAKSLVNGTKKNIEKGNFQCDGVFNEENGIYSFNYADVSDGAFLLFYIFHEPMMGNVVVDYRGEETIYYVSLTDREYGFPLTDVKLISPNTVKEYSSLDNNSLDTVYCEINS